MRGPGVGVGVVGAQTAAASCFRLFVLRFLPSFGPGSIVVVGPNRRSERLQFIMRAACQQRRCLLSHWTRNNGTAALRTVVPFYLASVFVQAEDD